MKFQLICESGTVARALSDGNTLTFTKKTQAIWFIHAVMAGPITGTGLSEAGPAMNRRKPQPGQSALMVTEAMPVLPTLTLSGVTWRYAGSGGCALGTGYIHFSGMS